MMTIKTKIIPLETRVDEIGIGRVILPSDNFPNPFNNYPNPFNEYVETPGRYILPVASGEYEAAA